MNSIDEAGMDTEGLEQTLREILSPSRLPRYIKSAGYELGKDHIGEPAVRIFLAIEPDTATRLDKDEALLGEYSGYKQSLMDQVLKLESGYFPFVRLVEAA